MSPEIETIGVATFRSISVFVVGAPIARAGH
jgi:hypothetical protein